jgi:O-antigen ligase
LKNPAFLIVCVLVAVTPLMRGSVNEWARTVIQILVVLGWIVLVLEAMRSKERQKRSSRSRDSRYTVSDGSGRDSRAGRSGSNDAGNRSEASRKGFSSRQLFWYVAVPCVVLGVWSAVMSPHPALAVQGLLMLVTYLGFFFLVTESVKSREEQRALVWVTVGTAVFLCGVGLLELYDVVVFSWWDYAAETGNAYSDSLTGAYVNRSHLAGFLEMAIPLLTAMFLTRSRPVEWRILMILGVVFLLVCQALTLSRGGWAGTTGALVFMAAVLLLKKGFAHKRLIGFILGGTLAAAVVVIASTTVVDRVNTLIHQDMDDTLEGRYRFWDGTIDLIKDNLIAGTGPGTFTVAFPPYQKPGQAKLPRYAHNDYLQFTADTGILFIPLMLWLLYLFFKTGFKKFQSRSRQTSGIALGCMAGVIAILIHSYSDGNLQIPANALLFTTLSALTLKSGV